MNSEPKPSPLDRLKDLVKQQCSQNEPILITMQNTPDPDSMASALGMQWLLEMLIGTTAEIVARSDVSHPQNQTMRNILDIRMANMPKHPSSEYGLVLVVDTVPQNTGFENMLDEFHGVIDHHHFEVDVDFADVRTCGACSTIIWEYLHQFEADWNTERGGQVATALLFGIQNDTGNLLSDNTCELDMEAHRQLLPHVDRKKLHDIINYSLPSYLYDLRCTAVNNKQVRDSMLIASLGKLTPKKRDALPIIADEFMRMEGIETVVVHAVVSDNIEASVRSRNSALNVHEFCQKIFGPSYAGGKSGSGGARTPIGFLYDSGDDEDLKEAACALAERLLARRILSFQTG